jgi:glycosyltransferase involved in cell wall biosynthesis
VITILSFLKVNNINGVSTFCKNLISIFNKDVNVISLYKSEEATCDLEKCIGLPRNFFYKLINWFFSYRLSSLLLCKYISKNTDIVIINSPSMLYYLNKRPKVVAIQHHSIDTLINNKANFNNNKKLIKLFKSRVDVFVVLSEKDKLEAIDKLNLSDSQVVTIPHMVNMDKGIPKRTFNRRLIMLSRLDNKQKRFDLVLEAMRYCRDWSLTIYGNGPDKEKILFLIKKYNLNNVYLKSAINNVEDALLNSDVHLMSSDYEGFGFTNIEAMRKGLPIIIRDTFPVASSLIDGNGVLLKAVWDKNEFLEALEKIEANYLSMSERSLLLSENYSESVISRKWNALIKNLEALQND